MTTKNTCSKHGDYLDIFEECPVCFHEKFPQEQNIGPYILFDEMLDSQEFYNLCQAYRHIPISDQAAVSKAFEAIKNYLKGIE